MSRRLYHAPLVAVLGLLATVVGLVPGPSPVQACAIAYHDIDATIDVDQEAALIVWDAESKTQHFIRQATFVSSSEDFGFFVPTPTQPELSEVDENLLNSLANLTKPRVVDEVKRYFKIGFGVILERYSFGAAAKDDARVGSVQILEQKRVGDYDATVLRADDTDVLKQWLEKHGYNTRATFDSWFDRYVQDGWVITAFKIAADAKNNQDAETYKAHASAIRLSFSTDQPFYPYREPEEMQNRPKQTGGNGRTLRLFFLADKRYAATIGKNGSDWPAETVWANPIDKTDSNAIFEKVKFDAPERSTDWYLTEFIDESDPRPGTDELYFSESADQSSVEREPIVNVIDDPYIIDIILIMIVMAFTFTLLVTFMFLKRRLFKKP